MATGYQGQPVTLTAEFFEYGGGPYADVTGLTVGITDPSGTVELVATSAGITHLGTGIYQYVWTIPGTAPIGDHLVTWSANSGAVTATEVLTVGSASSVTWCTIGDVPLITTVTVDNPTLLAAGYNIDVACARPFATDSTHIGSRDLYWLKVATAYQAAWLSTQVDAFNRIDALDISQGRSRTQLRDTAMFLAPHARKALKRVSWLKSRSVHIRSPFTDRAAIGAIDPLSAEADWYGTWEPID
jgi:hypothetical protein